MLFASSNTHILAGSFLIPDHIFSPTNIEADIYPEGDKQIHNEWRAHSDKGGVNKIFAHNSRRQVHFFTQVLANAEGMPFYQIFEPVLQHELLFY